MENKQSVDILLPQFFSDKLREFSHARTSHLVKMIKAIENFRPDHTDYEGSEDNLILNLKWEIRKIEQIDTQVYVIKQLEKRLEWKEGIVPIIHGQDLLGRSLK